MGWLRDLVVRRGSGLRGQDATLPLYNAVVARARLPHWYVEGAVPDTVDGRFDTVAAVLATVLIRLEDEPGGAEPAARLAERFVDDMDSQLRQIGIGDMVVGRHIGQMMSMLGGRLGAYRAGLTGGGAGGDLAGALVRNLYRGTAPAPAALAHVADALARQFAAVRATTIDRLVAGDLP